MILDSHSLLRPLNFQFFRFFFRFAYFFPVIRKYCEFPIPIPIPIPSYISIPINCRCRLQVAGCRGNIMQATNQLDEVALPRHLFGNNHHLPPTCHTTHSTERLSFDTQGCVLKKLIHFRLFARPAHLPYCPRHLPSLNLPHSVAYSIHWDKNCPKNHL